MYQLIDWLTTAALARVISKFFTLGQTLETFRGQGIHQAAVDTAIKKINQGGWVRLQFR